MSSLGTGLDCQSNGQPSSLGNVVDYGARWYQLALLMLDTRPRKTTATGRRTSLGGDGHNPCYGWKKVKGHTASYFYLYFGDSF